MSSEKQSEDFKILMQACPPMDTHLQILEVNLGPEDWRLLAEGLKSHPGVVKAAFTVKESLDNASKEHLRVLWDALRPNGILGMFHMVDGILEEPLRKGDGEAAWIRLCQMKDLSLEEWVALDEEAEGGDEEGEVEEEDEEEDMGEEGAEEEVVGGEGYEGDEEDV